VEVRDEVPKVWEGDGLVRKGYVVRARYAHLRLSVVQGVCGCRQRDCGGASALAAKAATSTIPIVFANGSDPVALGLVASINEPGGNVTGITWFGSGLDAKRVEVMRDLLPDVAVIGFLVNSANPSAMVQVANAQAAIAMNGRKAEILSGRTETEITASFTKIARDRIGALVVALDPFLLNRRDQLLELASTYKVPTIYGLRDYTVAGGLISYGNSLTEGYRLAGQYVARVLAGATPRDMPVIRATRFELVINLRTAKALGVNVPPALLAWADEVIE
jgi:putative tryptophan/tyrosine transport system substrate-binding protein